MDSSHQTSYRDFDDGFDMAIWMQVRLRHSPAFLRAMRAPDSLSMTVGTSSPRGTKRTISAICHVVSDPQSCRLPCQFKERDDIDYNHMRALVDVMQKDRRLIRTFHSEFTSASMQLASQLSHVLAEKFSSAPRRCTSCLTGSRSLRFRATVTSPASSFRMP